MERCPVPETSGLGLLWRWSPMLGWACNDSPCEWSPMPGWACNDTVSSPYKPTVSLCWMWVGPFYDLSSVPKMGTWMFVLLSTGNDLHRRRVANSLWVTGLQSPLIVPYTLTSVSFTTLYKIHYQLSKRYHRQQTHIIQLWSNVWLISNSAKNQGPLIDKQL